LNKIHYIIHWYRLLIRTYADVLAASRRPGYDWRYRWLQPTPYNTKPQVHKSIVFAGQVKWLCQYRPTRVLGVKWQKKIKDMEKMYIMLCGAPMIVEYSRLSLTISRGHLFPFGSSYAAENDCVVYMEQRYGVQTSRSNWANWHPFFFFLIEEWRGNISFLRWLNNGTFLFLRTIFLPLSIHQQERIFEPHRSLESLTRNAKRLWWSMNISWFGRWLLRLGH